MKQLATPETAGTEWTYEDLLPNIGKLRHGDKCRDPQVTVIDKGYIYVNTNTVSICQEGMSGKVNNIQLNGPFKEALKKALK